MSRLMFEARRRLPAPRSRKTTIAIEPPPELPRLVPPSLLRRALPFLIGFLVIAMVVAMIATGMRLMSPSTLFFPFMMLLTAGGLFHGTGTSTLRTEEVDTERADYLRYLSQIRANVRNRAAEQLAALLWSHPDPTLLATIAGSRRQWERDHGDHDFLLVRSGRHAVALDTTLRVKDIADEIDLEPVSHSALHGLLSIQRNIQNAPVGINLRAIAQITIIGDQAAVRATLRAWVTQAVVWHDPTVLTFALASPELESEDWSWTKWLPHVHISGKSDGVGPARYLSTSTKDLTDALATACADREPHTTDASFVSHKQLLIVLDDPTANPEHVVPHAGLAGVTLVHRSDTPPHPDYEPPASHLFLELSGTQLRRWHRGKWKPYVDAADDLEVGEAQLIARQLSRWDSNLTGATLQSAATRGASFTSLLSIDDASALDVPELWSPRSREEELRVPIGTTAAGQPLYFDLKDEAEGGMGPHGLMIGMTGSGKSQTLMSILLALLTTHSADRLIVIYADFKGEAGADIFRHFPQVVAVISNMSDKKSLADRFADTLRGEVDRRERMLKEAGRQIQGGAFNSVLEYENAIAAGHDLPPIPTLFVVADEFTLMLQDHPEYAELFDYVARKGRSFRIHILFASQTLDIGKIKDIDKNTSYRIGLKVASPSISRQIIGVDDAYHIESGKDFKGVGFLVPAPGAAPIKFRSTYVDGIYEPPRKESAIVVRALPRPKVFSAAWVQPEEDMVILEETDPLPPSPPKKLITTIGDQLAQHGPQAPALWLPPLDEPIPLDTVLARVPDPDTSWTWPLGEIDKPFEMRRDPLLFDAESSAGNMVIHGGPKSGKSTALQTFILSAAARYSPRDVQFYCIDYGGGALRALEDLAHVGSVASGIEEERIRRTFGEIEQLLLSRQRLFRDQGVPSLDYFRKHRATDPRLHDGFGDVFLIIDNIYGFSRDNTDQFQTKNPLLAKVSELVNIGLSYGIHVVITTPSWLEIPLNMRDGFGLRLELKLHDAQDSNVRVFGALSKPADSVPHNQPGRGLTMTAQHFLIAAPRLDGEKTAVGLSDALALAVRQVNAKYPNKAAPSVRLLPLNVVPSELGPNYALPERIVIGQREDDLAPVCLDLAASPLVMVFGDRKSGKTTLLRHIIRTTRAHHTPNEIAFTVLDRRLQLVDEPLFPNDEYTPSIDRIIPAMQALGSLIENRRPTANLSAQQLRNWSYTGPAYYLIIDDFDQIPDTPATMGPYAGQRPWAPIIGLLGQAADLGFRVIITARASGSAHSLMANQMLKRFTDMQATTIMLSGNPQEGGKIRGHRFSRLPPGRAMLLEDSDTPTFIQIANPLLVEQHSLSRGV